MSYNGDFSKSYDGWLQTLGGDEACSVCRYQSYGCTGGVHGGPNGPIFPPCADTSIAELSDEDTLLNAYHQTFCDNCTSNMCTGCEHQHEN